MSSSTIFVCIWLLYLPLFISITLPTGKTSDDWSVFDGTTGWINGDMTIISGASENKYHGLFDGDTGETLLSRNDVQLEASGTLTMNFTLIFACNIIDTLDKISVSVGTQTTDYYIIKSANDYPYKSSSGFTINIFNTAPLFDTLCNSSSWSIHSSLTSKVHEAHTTIYIAFESTFNYSAPYDSDNKYWTVNDIEFNVISTEVFESNTASIVLAIVISVILLLLIIPLLRYCYKSKKVHDKKRKALLKTVSLQSIETKTKHVQNIETAPQKIETAPQKTEENAQQSDAYKAAIRKNNKLKSERVELKKMQQKLSKENTSIDNESKIKENEFRKLQSRVISLEHDIVEIEKANKAKQVQLEQHIEAREADVAQQTQHDMTATAEEEWLALASFPALNEAMSLVEMNYCEFGALACNEKTQRMHMYKYGTNDTWALCMESSDSLQSTYWVACGDRMSETVFMYGNDGEMIVFDASKRNINTVNKLSKTIVDGSQCALINGRVHIFGGVDCFHLLWNPKIQIMKQLRGDIYIERLKNNKHFCVVALEKRKKLLLFGGNTAAADDIYQYSLHDCSWNRLKVKLPFNMHSFGCVVSANEEYMMIFAGIRDDDTEMDDIFILNLNNMEFSATKCKCPCAGKCRAFWMNYKNEYGIVLSAFMRESVDKHIDTSIYQLIMELMVANDIHLIHSNTNMHWRINTNAISAGIA